MSHASQRRQLLYLVSIALLLVALGLGTVALLSNQWGTKFPVLGPILARIPTPLAASSGLIGTEFNPNRVAGSLLYVLPLGIVICVMAITKNRYRWWFGLPLLGIVGGIGLILLLTRSRGALLGLLVALVGMGLMRWRQGLLVIGLGLALVVMTLPWIPFDQILGSTTGAEAVVGTVSFSARQEIWNRALYAISDFPFTGSGLGNYAEIVRLLYPLFLIGPDFNFDHAHNFFLQMAVDFGLPGLIALLVLYLSATVHLVRLRWAYSWRSRFGQLDYWACS